MFTLAQSHPLQVQLRWLTKTFKNSRNNKEIQTITCSSTSHWIFNRNQMCRYKVDFACLPVPSELSVSFHLVEFRFHDISCME